MFLKRYHNIKLFIFAIATTAISLNSFAIEKIDFAPTSKEARDAVKKFINAENGNVLEPKKSEALKTKKENIILQDHIVVTVNGEPISLLDVSSLSFSQERALHQQVKDPKQILALTKQIRLSALNHLIERKLIIQDYHDDPFDIDNQYIESEVDRLAELAKITNRLELKNEMTKAKKDVNYLHNKAKNNVIYQMMVSSYFYREGQVTPKEVYEYYKKNIKIFQQQKMYLFSTLFIRKDTDKFDEKVATISEDLKKHNKEIFNSLQEIYNPDIKQSSSWFAQKKLRKEFIEPLSKIIKGQISKPIKIKEGVVFLLVEDVKPAKIKSVTEVYSQIKNIIEDKKHREIYDKKVKELKTKAIITYEFNYAPKNAAQRQQEKQNKAEQKNKIVTKQKEPSKEKNKPTSKQKEVEVTKEQK
ncbi:peptidyl-prolyl cis-trans isomerase [Lentisphaerota bacterium WC36G]|nr:peptidyl-prolyl cis-trans isomerase [Lentisphaerae bacterium WC36]